MNLEIILMFRIGYPTQMHSYKEFMDWKPKYLRRISNQVSAFPIN